MFLDRKVKSSSIAEVVIALTVIAICIGVASLVFVRSTNVASRFADVKKQTEIQTELFDKMHRERPEYEEWEDREDVVITTRTDEQNDSLQIIEFMNRDGKVLWSQQLIKEAE